MDGHWQEEKCLRGAQPPEDQQGAGSGRGSALAQTEPQIPQRTSSPYVNREASQPSAPQGKQGRE